MIMSSKSKNRTHGKSLAFSGAQIATCMGFNTPVCRFALPNQHYHEARLAQCSQHPELSLTCLLEIMDDDCQHGLLKKEKANSINSMKCSPIFNKCRGDVQSICDVSIR